MRTTFLTVLGTLFLLGAGLPAFAQTAVSPLPPATTTAPAASGSDLRIEWEVKNRFRLFRSEQDFQRHVAA
ncbi:MAG: hypothetical protein ABUL48_00750, partial [Pseudorhodoplanes sp.]